MIHQNETPEEIQARERQERLFQYILADTSRETNVVAKDALNAYKNGSLTSKMAVSDFIRNHHIRLNHQEGDRLFKLIINNFEIKKLRK